MAHGLAIFMSNMDQKKYLPIESPFVTVIVPVFNEEDCIKDCLLSLLRQNFKPLEIIVVDDGSTDNSVAVCENLKVKVIKEDHKGMGAARNLGAFNAKGNLLALLDADMVFAPDYVSKLAAPIIIGKTVATCHWNEMVANWDNPWARCQTWFHGLPDRRRHPLAVAEGSGQYRMVRKDFFIDSGGLTEEDGYRADISIWCRTGVLAEIVPDALCYHRNIAGPNELYKESLWRGRSFAVIKRHRLRRCLATMLVYQNPLMSIFRGIRMGVIKNEPRLPVYAAICTFGIMSGILHAIFRGYYQK